MKTIHTIWLKHPAGIYTANDLDASNGIVIKNDKIIELVGKGCEPVSTIENVIDCRDMAITPGLINTHHHFYQTLTRCVPQALNKPLFPWLKTLYQVWKNLDSEMLSAATQLASLELMLSGTSTVCDHHYVFPKGLENSIDIQIEALADLGCRANLTRGSMSLGESDGGLPPNKVIQQEDVILQDSERVVSAYHQRHEGAMTQIALAPCSPFSVSTELMKETAILADKLDVLMHTHLAETEDEDAFCIREFGMRPLDYLESCGWLNERTWLAHGIHFNADEISRLGKANIGIAHCPSSNMLLASGICPTLALQKAGCRVGLAVDGSASNDCSNMIQEARQSLLQQRLKYGAAKITAEGVLHLATKGSASVLHRPDIGEIAVGKQADLALFNLNDLRFSGTGDAIAALIQCGAHEVDKLMVAGKWIVEDGQHKYIDAQALMDQHKSFASKLQTAN
ncbi:8-oxoguanine deaminase [Glaciecola petra]|uniref:8-oxoguanine deaminase n=1 Tax=Glaciecola petra TaxID=3075602 RepID=A0ABU2ZXN5_9ALTE|nr:8-oxoguanine deaminase [Aestuariibacter sp. P117]MDT0596167.1 8-oxoguanine deaminase [Aestuariibacter sp. P117]